MENTYTSVEVSPGMAEKIMELLASGGGNQSIQSSSESDSSDSSISPSLEALEKYTKTLTLSDTRTLETLGKTTQPHNLCPNLQRLHIYSTAFSTNVEEALDADQAGARLRDLLRVFTRLVPSVPHAVFSFSPGEFLVTADEPERGLPSIITLRQKAVVPILLPVDTLTFLLPSALYTESEWTSFGDLVKLYELALCWVPRNKVRFVFEFNQALTGAKQMGKVFSRLILVAGEIYGEKPYPAVKLEIVIPYKAGFTEPIAKTLTTRLYGIMGATLEACRAHELEGDGKEIGERGEEEWRRIMRYWEGGNVEIKGMGEEDIANA
ncbi:hypothetical protein L202_02605 [Cryptococcus amylolentus CBS 6039]|uniref:Uncharacterized protein n=1 Tax=Cryptococcus amylolentus CBS 6039 TaxID=1295533 RepID=A0A1E3HW09_9TREE|nr:hypothetical protein L202_02605 [Cryptococcus amylolentus CBS 6039]ODN80345.1 hypothetical protein L202_02605 [Cryptococcus amylolentus CBS 6039]